MAELWQYNGYTYTTKSLITSNPRELVAKTRVADVVGRHGQYSQGGLVAGRPITLRGHLSPASGDVLETLWDDFVAAHFPNTPKVLYLGRDDRYINAEVLGVKDVGTYGVGDDFPTSIPWEVQFLASDPFVYAATASGPTSVNAGGTVTTAGKSSTPPTIVLVISAVGTSAAMTLTNTTTGKVMVVAMPGATTTLTINCALQKITNTGGTDVTDLLTSGSFWELASGANVITKSMSGGATSSSCGVSWRDAWAL